MKDTGNVPAHEVLWVARHKDWEPVFVKARSWFDARKEAMTVFGCGPDDLTVKLDV